MKIVIVGGGSFQWVPTLTTDLVLTPSLRGAEIVLQDIDAARLAGTAPVVEHVSELTGRRVRGARHRSISGRRCGTPTSCS